MGLNVCRELEILTEIVGGLPAILPFEGDFLDPETSKHLEKYLKRREGLLWRTFTAASACSPACWPSRWEG